MYTLYIVCVIHNFLVNLVSLKSIECLTLWKEKKNWERCINYEFTIISNQTKENQRKTRIARCDNDNDELLDLEWFLLSLFEILLTKIIGTEVNVCNSSSSDNKLMSNQHPSQIHNIQWKREQINETRNYTYKCYTIQQ